MFEQEREALLVAELEDLLAAVDGGRLDATLFAQLGDADAERVRAALGHLEPEPYDEDDEDDDDDETGVVDEDLVFSPFEFDAVGVAGDDDVEEEIERLQEELAVSRRAQIALGRYLELLFGRYRSAPDGRRAAKPGRRGRRDGSISARGGTRIASRRARHEVVRPSWSERTSANG